MRVLLLNKRKELEIEQRRLQAHRPSSAGRGELAPPPPPAQGPTEGRAENSASPSHEPGSRPGPTPGSSTGRGVLGPAARARPCPCQWGGTGGPGLDRVCVSLKLCTQEKICRAATQCLHQE